MASPDGLWEVTYSMLRDQDRRRNMRYDGKIQLWVARDWISVLNAKGEVIGDRRQD
jgi:hypothetical protein